jgi:serine/threonine protein kinase
VWQELYAEIQIHKFVSRGKAHLNVVNFLDWFEDRDNVYMLLELCDRGVRTPAATFSCAHRTHLFYQ